MGYMDNDNEARLQYLLSQQQAQQSAFGSGLFGGLGSLSGMGGSAGGTPYWPELHDLELRQRMLVVADRQRVQQPAPAAKIGKVTAKPGYILDPLAKDGVRAKIPSDYTRFERVVIWWNSLD